MSVHEQHAEDLALYALGALAGDEKTSLEKHLSECGSCRRELEQLRGDAVLLALSTAGPKPPARSKTRLMSALEREPRPQRARLRVPWLAALGWFAAIIILVFGVALWKQNTRLSSTISELSGMLERQRAESEQARKLADLMKAPDAASYVVMPVKMKAPPPPSGKAVYSPSRSGLIFMASNLHSLPAGKAYELWLVPKDGSAPMPAGMFKPDAHGGAMVVNPPLPAGVEAKAFAITVEPEQGSATPTLPIIMIGTGG